MKTPVSNIHWHDQLLYQDAKHYAERHNQTMNTLIMEAVSQYLKTKTSAPSKLARQTAQFNDSSLGLVNGWKI